MLIRVSRDEEWRAELCDALLNVLQFSLGMRLAGARPSIFTAQGSGYRSRR